MYMLQWRTLWCVLFNVIKVLFLKFVMNDRRWTFTESDGTCLVDVLCIDLVSTFIIFFSPWNGEY